MEKDLQAIAWQLHDILAELQLTLNEADEVYNKAAKIARMTPGFKELLDNYRNAPLKKYTADDNQRYDKALP